MSDTQTIQQSEPYEWLLLDDNDRLSIVSADGLSGLHLTREGTDKHLQLARALLHVHRLNAMDAPDAPKMYRESGTKHPFHIDWDVLIAHSGLSLRASNALRRAGLKYVSDILRYSDSQLMQIPQFGASSLNEVRSYLSARSLEGISYPPVWSNICYCRNGGYYFCKTDGLEESVCVIKDDSYLLAEQLERMNSFFSGYPDSK